MMTAAITVEDFELFQRAWPKACSCGMKHTEASFQSLPLVGVLPAEDIPPLEHRNCSCGTTLVVPVVDIRSMYVEVRKGHHVHYQRA
jgi:hypothetical protein